MAKQSRPFIDRRDDRQWPLLVLLSVIVLLSSATVLWLTNVAVRNERGAIRQRLVGAYEKQLRLAAAKIDDHWSDTQRQCVDLARHASNGQLFADCVRASLADSVLILGPGGTIDYPMNPNFDSSENSKTLNRSAWSAANRLEFVHRNLDVAAEAYDAIAKVELDASAEASARLAQARCLAKDNRRDDASMLLMNVFDREKLRYQVDDDGRSLWLNAQLRILQLLTIQSVDPKNATKTHILSERKRIVRSALNDYTWDIPASQRLFAIKEFMASFPDAPSFDTMAAEQLAAVVANRVANTTSPAVWSRTSDYECLAMSEAPVVLVYRPNGLESVTEALLHDWQSDDCTIALVLEQTTDASNDTIASTRLRSMPTYRLALTLNDSRLLDDALQEQTAMYTVAALFTVTAVAAFALLVGYFVRRQLTLARLKNDLVAVVAHELRTPLASSRLLVDTLLEGDPDQNQQQEYLRMIASENERLTRLVENFLSFSRIQSGRNQFVFRVVSPSNIATRAVEVVSPTMGASGRQFRSEIEDDLPSIRVDADAVVTALTNLLENAIKFSAEDGQITMRVRSLDDAIVFEVQDDGIGMSTGDSSRAFDKFFQADRELSRNHGGCGLGLSLVRSIVHSHGGTVRVESELNQGSLFRVLLPIANSDSGNQKEQVA